MTYTVLSSALTHCAGLDAIQDILHFISIDYDEQLNGCIQKKHFFDTFTHVMQKVPVWDDAHVRPTGTVHRKIG
jgi:hypothetical protein